LDPVAAVPARSGSEPMHRLATSPGSDHWKLEVGAEGGGHGRVRMVLVMFIIMTWEIGDPWAGHQRSWYIFFENC